MIGTIFSELVIKCWCHYIEVHDLSSVLPGAGGHHLWRNFQPWNTSRWKTFSFLVRLAWMASQHAQTLSVDLLIASVFFPPGSGPLTQLARVKLSWDATDVLFLQLETKCLLENPLFHVRPSKPAGRRSFELSSMRPRLCYRKRRHTLLHV